MRKTRRKQEELLVHKLISGIQTVAYDILQEVFTAAVPQLVQENEILKSMRTELSKQVSDLKRETYEMKVAKPLAFPDIFHQGISLQKLNPSTTETPSNAFVIDVKGDTSQPASKQIHQKEVQHPLTTPNSKLPNKEWASLEEDPNQELLPQVLKVVGPLTPQVFKSTKNLLRKTQISLKYCTWRYPVTCQILKVPTKAFNFYCQF